MAHVVELDLTPADFRLHPGVEPLEPHWLLKHPYGRDLLACKLREVRPDAKFMHYRIEPEIFPLLESMATLLDLREWPRPRTVSEKVSVMILLLRMVYAFKMGRELPDWR